MKHPRILVYVAGPFSPTAAQKAKIPDTRPTSASTLILNRAAVEENIAKAAALALQVAEAGAMPMCPHSNTALPAFEDAQPYDFWIAGTDEMLLRCDVAIFVEGWEQSSGARGEMRTCETEGIPHFYTITDLVAFLEGPESEVVCKALRMFRTVYTAEHAELEKGSTIPAPPPLPRVSEAPTAPPSDFGQLEIEYQGGL